MNHDSILKDGQFTDEIIQKLHEKMVQIGITKCAIARRFGVSPVTFYKWLKGKTRRCSIAARRKISSFLKENEEGIIPFQYPLGSEIYGLPDSMLLCMERVSKAYDLISTSKDKSKYFINAIDKAALDALEHLLNLKTKEDKQA